MLAVLHLVDVVMKKTDTNQSEVVFPSDVNLTKINEEEVLYRT